MYHTHMHVWITVKHSLRSPEMKDPVMEHCAMSFTRQLSQCGTHTNTNPKEYFRPIYASFFHE